MRIAQCCRLWSRHHLSQHRVIDQLMDVLNLWLLQISIQTQLLRSLRVCHRHHLDWENKTQKTYTIISLIWKSITIKRSSLEPLILQNTGKIKSANILLKMWTRLLELISKIGLTKETSLRSSNCRSWTLYGKVTTSEKLWKTVIIWLSTWNTPSRFLRNNKTRTMWSYKTSKIWTISSTT